MICIALCKNCLNRYSNPLKNKDFTWHYKLPRWLDLLSITSSNSSSESRQIFCISFLINILGLGCEKDPKFIVLKYVQLANECLLKVKKTCWCMWQLPSCFIFIGKIIQNDISSCPFEIGFTYHTTHKKRIKPRGV